MAVTTKPRLLAKMRPGAAQAVAAGFKFRKIRYRIEPLFRTRQGRSIFGAAAEFDWHIIESIEETDETNLWDLAYDSMLESLGMPGADVAIVEPDLPHKWAYENPTPLQPRDDRFAAAETCVFNDQNPRDGDTPAGPGFGWHLLSDFSQLKQARDEVSNGKRKVRIGHFDTGFDPNHVTRPEFLNLALQKNFVPGETENDAADPAQRGFIKQPGHGTGTLSILAGNKLSGVAEAGQFQNDFAGGAPRAEIVPVRVANSVVLFFTSAVAKAFAYVVDIGADVVSMSMGGAASAAWTDMVNRAYEAGVFIVCAAGNNFGGLPTKNIVYPARYKRVTAACGVMEDGRPYNDLPPWIMQGNYGPSSKMDTAIAAYTPNIPWAELGCSKIVDMDGQGTSSATPQVAAAGALWLMKHDPHYSEGWQKVEAVRHALFSTALNTNQERFGRGILQAATALGVAPPQERDLKKTKPDSASLSILRVLTGLGVAADPRGPMFELEAAQLLQTSATLERILEEAHVDPEQDPITVSPKVRQRLMEAMAAEPRCSSELRRHLERNLVTRGPADVPATLGPAVKIIRRDTVRKLPAPPPHERRLRAYAFDPSLGFELQTAVLNETTMRVPWEESLEPGPVGEYLEVVDIDPATGCGYRPVDLNEPFLLAQDGLAPSEGDPQFHQQMVYAVSMKTIKTFERALGRVALWASRTVRRGEKYKQHFVRRLRIYPHALRAANAYYSPERKALLFGYFPASRLNPGRNLPGGMVFTCLSHDVVAHETTHALLDGIHPRFGEPSNPDVLALHEAFADIVALFQHFSLPEALRHQIARTRGDLAKQSLLGELAQQFGEALGRRGALRHAIGGTNPETGQWEPREPDPNDYVNATESHERGAILVATVFDAFLAIYRKRAADLLRIATGGTGALPEGDIHPDLVNRLAEEAAKTAEHIGLICIRALDYCPPVDITFGEYLRALITADWDLVPDDAYGYRIAFIEAFRRRGIYPESVRTLSVDSLRWQVPSDRGELDGLDQLLDSLDLTWDLEIGRMQAHRQAQRNQFLFWRWMAQKLESREYLRELGLAWGENAPPTIVRNKKGEVATEVHSVRPARRLGPDGSFVTDVVIELTQRRREPYDPTIPEAGNFLFRGGCTLLIDVKRRKVRYAISKNIAATNRLERQRAFLGGTSETSLYATYFGDPRRNGDEPFAILHQGI
jgi:hypothetical protein